MLSRGRQVLLLTLTLPGCLPRIHSEKLSPLLGNDLHAITRGDRREGSGWGSVRGPVWLYEMSAVRKAGDVSHHRADRRQPQELHLCETCAKTYLTQGEPGAAPVAPTLANVLAKQLQIGKAAEELAKLDQRACPVCGITFYEFRNQGRLGCPHDYVYFERELTPLIANIHGETQHVGKRPRGHEGGHRRADRADSPAPRDGRGEAERSITSGRRRFATRFASWRREAAQAPAARPAKAKERPSGQSHHDRRSSTNWPIAAANGCAAPARKARSSSPAAFAWPATWRSFRSSAAAPTATAQAIEKTFKDAIAAVDDWKSLLQVEVADLPTLDRQFLVERQLISRELSEVERGPLRLHRPAGDVQPDDQRGGSPADAGDAQRPRHGAGLGADQHAWTICSPSA